MTYKQLKELVTRRWVTHRADHLTIAALSDHEMCEAKHVQHWMDSQLKVVVHGSSTLVTSAEAKSPWSIRYVILRCMYLA